MENLAYDYVPEELEEINDDEEDYEIIGGVKFIMSPAPNVKHGTIISILTMLFNNHIYSNNINAIALGDNVDIYLSDEDHVKPDVSIIRNLGIVNWNGVVKGAPDLVVEVLSKSTMKNDIGIKKDTYAKYGVKEYWIVSPWSKSITVYHLVNDKFELDEVYKIYNSTEWERLTEKERKESKFDIKVSIFDDLFIDIRKVFKWWLDD